MPRESADWPLVGFILMVDEFRPDNGATRFVPGSHLWLDAPEEVTNPRADYEGQVLACGPAGSLLIFHGSAWHGHTANTSARPRRSLQSAFIPRDGRAGIDFANADASRDARAPQSCRAVCAPPLTLSLNVPRPHSVLQAIKVAAYQAPLAACADGRALSLVRQQVDRCETLGVALLCCPEALLGGLADYVDRPDRIAMETGTNHLARMLATLASDRVTTVIGFTERGNDGHLYNAAAVCARGAVLGIYRKLHPAINRSVYRAGDEAPVFTAGGVTFGVLLCRDSLFPEPARLMVSRGAQILFVPTNNGMPPAKGGAELVGQARACDVARAAESGLPVVRADVAGVAGGLVSYGSSGIVNRDGRVRGTALALASDLVIASVHILVPGHQGSPPDVGAALGQGSAQRAV